MRCAFISTILQFPWGGADTLWTRAAEAAADRGDSLLLGISAAAAEHERVRRLVARGAQLAVRRPPATPGLAGRIARRFAPREDPLVAALAAFKPDAVWVSCGGTYDLVLEPDLVRFLRDTRTRLRVIANWQAENPSLPEPDRRNIEEAFGLAERIFFVSTRNRESTRRHLLLPLAQASVVQNPLRLGPGAALPWPDESTGRFATVSRLDHGKGIALLLHALAAELGGVPGWRLEIFGRGPDEDRLRAAIGTLGLGERVRLRGHVATLAEIWQENHMLVSPAIEDGVPMTLAEAMLCGRTVLATCVGGAEDWIADGRTGFLCPAPTLPLLRQSLRTAWEQRPRWRELADAAATAAGRHYRPDDYLALLA